MARVPRGNCNARVTRTMKKEPYELLTFTKVCWFPLFLLLGLLFKSFIGFSWFIFFRFLRLKDLSHFLLLLPLGTFLSEPDTKQRLEGEAAIPNHSLSLLVSKRPGQKIFAYIDPRGQPTITAGSDHCFHTYCPSVRPSVSTFQNLAKQNKLQAKTMFTTGEIVGLAEWIIDDTFLSLSVFFCRKGERELMCFCSSAFSLQMGFWFFPIGKKYSPAGH